MIELKSHTSDPLEWIIDAAMGIYPRAKIDREDPEDQKRLIQMCIRDGNLSVFTHASAKIVIECSYCAARELMAVNNDVTVKTWEPSDRNNLSFITPQECLNDDKLKSIYTSLLRKVQSTVKEMIELGDDMDYHYILPGCVKTDIIISTSFLEFLKILKLIRYRQTSEEMKDICEEIYIQLNGVCSLVFNKANLKYKI